MSTAKTVIERIGYRLGKPINASSDPSMTEALSWINETVKWCLIFLAEQGSEVGRKTGTITTVDGTAYSTSLATDMYIPMQFGWVLTTHERKRIYLCTEEKSLEYDPSYEDEPEFFYLTADNYVYFLPTPDAVYTVKIPYWYTQTTIDEFSDTMPFGGMLDILITEAVIQRALNRNEYDTSFELKWMSFIQERIKAFVWMRKNQGSSIESVKE